MKTLGVIMLMIAFILFAGLIAISTGDNEIQLADTALIAIIMLWGFGGINYGVGAIAEKVEEINERQRESDPKTNNSSPT